MDVSDRPRIGVVGATGAVGTVTLVAPRRPRIRARARVRVGALGRLAGPVRRRRARRRGGDAGRARRRRRRPLPLLRRHVGQPRARARRLGGRCDLRRQVLRLSPRRRLPARRPRGERPTRALDALERDRIVANPNCCTIPLTCVLKPLHDEAGLARVRVSTYQSVSGAGAQRMDALAAEAPADHDLVMDWAWEGDESDEEAKLRAETRKILELPDLPISATCVRVPVMVGHSEAVWVELERAAVARRRRRDAAGGAERPRPRPAGGPDPGRGGGRGRDPRRADPAGPRRPGTASRSTSRATTSARARRSTRSRSPRCCSRAPPPASDG